MRRHRAGGGAGGVGAALVGALVAGAVAAGAVAVWMRRSPWPSVRLIRAVFDRGAREAIDEMTPHVPPIAYCEQRRPGLHVIAPAAAEGPLPAVVWVHGGAWISGSADNVEPYLRILAAHGYVGVALDYTISPEAAYPVAIRQLDDALGRLSADAAELGIDPERMVLAGDSAGAQLASQLALLTVQPHYAAEVGVTPSIDAKQLAGVLLHCGIYDLAAMSVLRGVLAWGFRTALWAYTGVRDWSGTPAARQMSTLHRIGPGYPPVFVSGGNGDGLTALQSIPLAEHLAAQGVDTTPLFWPADHVPALPHEYQFHLDLPEAQEALQRTLDFLARVTGSRPAAAPAPATASAPAAAPAPTGTE